TGGTSAHKQIHTGKFYTHTFQQLQYFMVIGTSCCDILLIPRIEHLSKTSRRHTRSNFFIHQSNVSEISQLCCLHKGSWLIVGNPLTSLSYIRELLLLFLIRRNLLQAPCFLCVILNPCLDSLHQDNH